MKIPSTWNDLLGWFKQNQSGKLKVLPNEVQHPRDAGMTVALDIPAGQRTTYKMMLATNVDLVVRDFTTYYEAFLELRPTPTPSGIEKALTESPGTSVAGMVAAGALLGLLFGRSKNSALVGAAIGGLAGLSGVGVANARSSPQTSKVAVDLLKLMKDMPIPLDDPPAKSKPVAAAKRPAPKKIPEAVKVEVLPREPRPRKKVSTAAKRK